jgi:hypothetical protein
VKLTCSAGMPWLEICGLYGSRVAVTEVTCAAREPGPKRGVADGVALQPSATTPLTTHAGTTNHGVIALTMVTESTNGREVALSQLPLGVTRESTSGLLPSLLPWANGQCPHAARRKRSDHAVLVSF